MRYVLLIVFFIIGCSDNLQTPLQKKNFSDYSTFKELKDYIYLAAKKTDLINIIDSSLTDGARSVYLLKIEIPNRVRNKLKVFIFAQQHGNEHSGKEASLFFINTIVNDKFVNDLENIIIYIIPQVNPDGSDLNQRRNKNNKDLNRDHLLLSQNETLFISRVFNRYLPHAVLDIHEYYPYSKKWIKFGYIKDFDVQFGSVTNPNISQNIFELAEKHFFNYIEKFLLDRNVSHHKYVVGGPPNLKRIRYSTTDINDGRQSTGIRNTFSFILEGRNGKTSSENLKERTLNQFHAISGWLSFLNENYIQIFKVMSSARENLAVEKDDSVVIRQDHYPGQYQKSLKLKNYQTGNDTIITIDNFHPVVKPHLKVTRPAGYLIEKNDSLLISWLNRNEIEFFVDTNIGNYKITQYSILKIAKSVDEELENFIPSVKASTIKSYSENDYIFVPTNNIAGNYLVIALEPQSQFGLVQYKMFNYLLKPKKYSIMRVENH